MSGSTCFVLATEPAPPGPWECCPQPQLICRGPAPPFHLGVFTGCWEQQRRGKVWSACLVSRGGRWPAWGQGASSKCCEAWPVWAAAFPPPPRFYWGAPWCQVCHDHGTPWPSSLRPQTWRGLSNSLGPAVFTAVCKLSPHSPCSRLFK